MANNPNAAANLNPAKPGEVRNPNGRPKGSKNLKTIVRELEAEDFDWEQVPTNVNQAVKNLGSPWKAIVYVALGQAVNGDEKAREWLRKSGYGDKLDLTSGGKPIAAEVTFVGGDPRKATSTD